MNQPIIYHFNSIEVYTASWVHHNSGNWWDSGLYLCGWPRSLPLHIIVLLWSCREAHAKLSCWFHSHTSEFCGARSKHVIKIQSIIGTSKSRRPIPCFLCSGRTPKVSVKIFLVLGSGTDCHYVHVACFIIHAPGNCTQNLSKLSSKAVILNIYMIFGGSNEAHSVIPKECPVKFHIVGDRKRLLL